MTRAEYFDAMHRICEEECDKVQEALIAAIRNRVKDEMPGAKLRMPKKPWPYSARSGPKVTNFPECDPRTAQCCMVLPIGNFEWPNEPPPVS